MPRVVIVGGGITGLAAAYELKRAGVGFTLFEKRPRLGGVIETQVWEDCIFDSGPDSFISSKPEALALLKEIGLGDEVIGSNDHQRTTYIWKKGRLVALPEGVMMIVPSKVMPMVRSPLLGWGTKIGMGFEMLRRAPKNPPADRSVAEFVTDHFGRETLDYLAEPLLSGVYGGDPAQLSVASVLPRFQQMETQHGSLARVVMFGKRPPSSGAPLFRTLKTGLTRMVEALSADANAAHCEVQTMERTADGFRLRAGGNWIEAQHAILACPAWAASALLANIDGELSRKLAGIAYSSSLTLSLVYESSAFDGKRAGFGFLMPAKERRRMAAGTFVGTKFPFRSPESRIVLRCFFGGAGDEAILSESDENILAIARDELRWILGLTAAPVYHTISRWPRSMAQYTVGHGARLEKIRERVKSIPGLHLAGNAYDGIGLPDCIRTGRAAAKASIS